MAVVAFVLLEKSSRNEVKVESSLGEGGHAVDVPVGETISYHSTCKRDVVECWVKCSLQVVLIDLPSEVRYINSSVTFTTYEKFVSFEFRELSVPKLKGSNGVLRLDHVIGLEILVSSCGTETDSGGTLEPNDVSLHVPGERVVLNHTLTVVDNSRSVLLHHTKHG